MPAASASHVAAVRRFNRFYTREIGLLRKTFLDTDWTLGEMRVLYELSHGEVKTASEIGRALDLDAGYLSRVLRKFEKAGLTPTEAEISMVPQTTTRLEGHDAEVMKRYPASRKEFEGIAVRLD